MDERDAHRVGKSFDGEIGEGGLMHFEEREKFVLLMVSVAW